jgi:hypothetical protein
MQEFLEESEGSVDVSAYMVRDAELMKWKGYVFDIVTPHSKRCPLNLLVHEALTY